jgi:hypothetical protein
MKGAGGKMKSALVFVALLVGTPFAKADPLADALREGRNSCGLNFQVIPSNIISSSSDFPGVPQVPPGWPPISSGVAGPSDFYAQGSGECGRASAALVRNPSASWACVVSSGPYLSKIYGVGTDSQLKAAALDSIHACVRNTGYTVYCLGINNMIVDVTCFNRN